MRNVAAVTLIHESGTELSFCIEGMAVIQSDLFNLDMMAVKNVHKAHV